METGTCKYGSTCKYHHPKLEVSSSAPVTMNTYGYPLRPGEKECSYYVKTGQCKFGISCKFDHPQFSGVPLPHDAVGFSAGLPTFFKHLNSTRSLKETGLLLSLLCFYSPGNCGPILFPPGVAHVPGWTPYLAPSSATSFPGSPLPFGFGRISGGASSSSKKEALFPKRPAQSECQDYLKTGVCRLGATYKYHHRHPPQRASPWTNVMLNPLGMPPNAAIMYPYYLRNVTWKMVSDHHLMTTTLGRSSSSKASNVPPSKLELVSEGEERSLSGPPFPKT